MSPDNMKLYNATSHTTDQLPLPLDPNLHWMVTFLDVAPKYLWIVVECFGLPGNVLSLLVSFQRNNRRVSTCNYIAALASADSLVLITIGFANLVIWYGLPATEFHLQ